MWDLKLSDQELDLLIEVLYQYNDQYPADGMEGAKELEEKLKEFRSK